MFNDSRMPDAYFQKDDEGVQQQMMASPRFNNNEEYALAYQYEQVLQKMHIEMQRLIQQNADLS